MVYDKNMKILNMPQFMNAITMIAPLCSFIRICKKSARPLSKMLQHVMSVHLPISFSYHLLSALTHSKLIPVLKYTDYALIHITTMVPLLHQRPHVFFLLYMILWYHYERIKISIVICLFLRASSCCS